MIKPVITWVTPDYFVDCDFNRDILSSLLDTYLIRWIILLPASRARISESDFDAIKDLAGLDLEFVYWKCRERSPKMLLFYEDVYRRIMRSNPTLIYFNYVPSNPYILPLYWRLSRRPCIFTAHDGSVKASFKMAWLSKLVFKLAFSSASTVHMFSTSEARSFAASYPRVKIFKFPLALKDFGEPEIAKRQDAVVFLFFGSIHPNKNLELLINAACNMYDQGVRGFKVVIKGYTESWEYYAEKIKYPHLFECDIRFYFNNELADIFFSAHYGVFPYREVSQSGALKVAFNYSLPVIVSDLTAFTEEVIDGINGFHFESENISSLEQVLTDRLLRHSSDYIILTEQVREFNRKHYSSDVLSACYVDMFESVISKTLIKS